MVKACPSCGAATVPEARFCRLCGAPLKAGGLQENDAPVSPLAQTIPLTGEGRATGGLNADEPQRPSSETSKVGRAEMENLLRRTPHMPADGDGEKSSPASSSVQQTATLSSGSGGVTSPPGPTLTSANPAPAPQPRQTSTSRSRRLWQVAAVALLFVALVAGVLAFVLSHRSNSSDNANNTPIAISDQKQLVSEKLAEAETLLAAGEFNQAIEVLRAAIKLDPTNTEAHIRLGNALERTGGRSEAIEEYRVAAQNSPGDVSAWRALAVAQFEEQLYNDAVDSYRRLLAASNNSFDEETWLAYGDALRLAGHNEEARAAYQKISASAPEPLAQEAHRHLAELGPPPSAPNIERTNETRNGTTAGGGGTSTGPTETATPTPVPVASVAPTPAPVANPVDYDGYYFQAVNIVNGRELKKIERAELLHALALFQRAALGGTHRAEAQRYADKLGKEYDRRRKV